MQTTNNTKVPRFTPGDFPLTHVSGGWRGGHVQGIAVDLKKRFIYYSYTTDFCKYDFDGKLIGSVGGFVGHIGCMCFNEDDGRVYASLEYKNDSIGTGIRSKLGGELYVKDGFYIVIFDVDKINRIGMNAETDGVATAVYLAEPTDDYHATVPQGEHRYGSSGIDGVTFMPTPGDDGKKYLTVAYGIYGDINRTDNDNQILLVYDTSEWKRYEMPLLQDNPHMSGPSEYLHKYFVHTGNTVFGVQNLEYDAFSGNTYVAVYPGKKQQYGNYYMYVINGSVSPRADIPHGLDEKHEMLTLIDEHSSRFPYGSTGIASLGDGYFYISEPNRTPDGEYGTTVRLYRCNGGEFTPAC